MLAEPQELDGAGKAIAKQKTDDPNQHTSSNAAEAKKPLELLGARIQPGTRKRLSWTVSQSFAGIVVSTPVVVVSGFNLGPTLCLTAAIHGDELNGIQILQRIVHSLEPDKLSGNVIGVPIMNLPGFWRNSRYLPDRRDLNRYFPGNANGSSAARIAHSFFQEIALQCDAVVDIHTASQQRTNLTQLRADLQKSAVKEMTRGFGNIVVLHSEGIAGTLRRAATDVGIPAVTLEVGEPHRIQPSKVAEGVRGIQSLMGAMKMVEDDKLAGEPRPYFFKSKWVRADRGGILLSRVRPGEIVHTGQVLAIVTDPITNERSEILSSHDGRVLGMALNQVVMPGYAAFRIGIHTDQHIEEDMEDHLAAADDRKSKDAVDGEE